jgi:hypothetical protein
MDTPTPDISTPVPQRRGPITDAEWDIILDTLRQHGPDSAKLVLAQGRTQADGRPARVRTLEGMLDRDPIKRQQWEDAERSFLSQFVQVLHTSARTPEVVRRFDKKTGTLIEERVSRRDMNWAALMVLRRYDPAWREQKRTTIDGQLKHDHSHSLGNRPDQYVVGPEDVMSLPPSIQSQLLEALAMIEENRLTEKENPRHVINQSKRPCELPAAGEETGQGNPG